MPTTRLIAGAMSGTSADGVDVALIRIIGAGYDMSPTLLAHHHRPYPPSLRKSIFAIRSTGSAKLSEMADLARQISLSYAAAINELLVRQGLPATELSCIAAHGQTLYHNPPNTIQWLDPALIAYEVGCPVVSDFRRADCAAGGQGAPLVPFADYILFRHPSKSRVLLNIGGIANLTRLPKTVSGTVSQSCQSPPNLIAFDTGPGNCICDHLCRTLDPAGPGYDPAGQRALRGNVDPQLVGHVMRHPFFHRTPPKSTDGPEMIAAFDQALRDDPKARSLDDLLATASHLTAQTILQAVFTAAGDMPDQIIVSGGGTHNARIMQTLRTAKSCDVRTTDELGLPSPAKEALAFALLAAATLDGIPANVPSVTGASRPVILGCITPMP